MSVDVWWSFMSLLGVDEEKFPSSSSLPVSPSGSVSFPVSLHHVLHALLIRVWLSVRSGKFLGQHEWQSLLTMMKQLRQPSYHLLLEWRSLVIWTKRVTLFMSHVAFFDTDSLSVSVLTFQVKVDHHVLERRLDNFNTEWRLVFLESMNKSQ